MSANVSVGRPRSTRFDRRPLRRGRVSAKSVANLKFNSAHTFVEERVKTSFAMLRIPRSTGFRRACVGSLAFAVSAACGSPRFQASQIASASRVREFLAPTFGGLSWENYDIYE